MRRFSPIRSCAALMVVCGLLLGGIAQAASSAGTGCEQSHRQESVQRLGNRATIAAAPRNARVRSVLFHRIQAEGPAAFAALPLPSASQAFAVQPRLVLRSVAATPHSGRSPPRFL
uniref:Uncharacterized protein n=1 Tax=Solibacter usitatus (strain Ellin6076) TaxID=234267 RepID=Q02AL7_SOLUE